MIQQIFSMAMLLTLALVDGFPKPPIDTKEALMLNKVRCWSCCGSHPRVVLPCILRSFALLLRRTHCNLALQPITRTRYIVCAAWSLDDTGRTRPSRQDERDGRGSRPSAVVTVLAYFNSQRCRRTPRSPAPAANTSSTSPPQARNHHRLHRR